KMRQPVAEINADGLVNFPRARIALFHQRLHELELFGKWQIRRRFNSSWRQKPRDALLREILYAATVIARPFIARRGGMIIHRHERQFIEPCGDVAVSVDPTACRARTERNAQD